VTVTGKQIKDGTVTGKDVKNRSLGAGDLSASALGSRAGTAGAAGVTNIEYRVSAGKTVPKDETVGDQVNCTSGKAVLGGGAAQFPSGAPARIVSSAPGGANGNSTGWSVQVHNEGGSTFTAFAWAVCANVTGPVG
jgi:hypothetical protein